MKVQNYSFSCWEKNRFNYKRICEEVESDNVDVIGFTLTAHGCPNAVVGLFNVAIADYALEEGVLVGMDILSPRWGVGLDVLFDGSFHYGSKKSSVRSIIVSVRQLVRIIPQIDHVLRDARVNYDDAKKKETFKVNVRSILDR